MDGGLCDVMVVGGGIAGVSAAYELAADRSVRLLEMEPTLAFHTTGRSAAMFAESYGGPVIRLLTTSSRSFLEDPPAAFDAPLLTGRPMLVVGPPGRAAAVVALEEEVRRHVPDVRCVGPEEALEICAVLDPAFVELAMLDPGAQDIDVHALHQGYVRGLRARGGEICVGAGVVALERSAGVWRVTDGQGGRHGAPVVINAAGAWCDTVARLAGVIPIGIRPLRRTLFTALPPEGVDTGRLPLTADVDMTFYFKGEGPQLLCSPADETHSNPCDARPEMADIAAALDRINAATTLRIRHVRSSWAGLRSFVADGVPVAGFDTRAEGFFWLAGQGGYGIQTAPALSRVTASLITTGDLPADLEALGLKTADLHPGRLA